jgi:hypothetical protein
MDTQTNSWVLCADGRQHAPTSHVLLPFVLQFLAYFIMQGKKKTYSTTKMLLVIIFALFLPFLQEAS